MPETKYQLFISSTYEDLKKERSKVIQTILTHYQFPIGMEMFSADNEEQWEVIRATIDTSDMYVLIIGHRYGSLTKGGKNAISYTQKEFEYALKNKANVPILAFIRERNHLVEASKLDPKNDEKLNKFIKKVTNSKITVDFFTTEDDLANKVGSAITKTINRFRDKADNKSGWVRKKDMNLSDSSQLHHTALLERCEQVYSALEESAARFQVVIDDIQKMTFDNYCNCTVERTRTMLCLVDVTHLTAALKSDLEGGFEIHEVSDISVNRGVGKKMPYIITEQSSTVLRFCVLFDRVIKKGETVKIKTKVTAKNFLADLITNGNAEFETNGMPGTTWRTRIETYVFPDNEKFKNLTITLSKVYEGDVPLNRNILCKIENGKKVFVIDYGMINANINTRVDFKIN